LRSSRRWYLGRTAGLVLSLALLLAACGGDGDGDENGEETGATGATGTTAEATGPTADATSLAGICPDPVVLQLDWEPESEHGGIYQLVGEGYEIDTDRKAVLGPLMASGQDTGVDVEVRIGGAAVGFQPVQALMYQDTDIFLGFARLTEAMASYEDLPVKGVMATFEKSAFAIYWDPETYPDAETIADLKEHDVTVYLGRPDVFQDYFIAEGIMDESQMDLSDHPKPAAFIGQGGAVAEAGFASAEPYLYEVEVPEWGRPVKLQLIHDAGFPEYFQALVARDADLAGEADCLERLVPILQQAEVDYFANPRPTNEFIVELVEAYDTGWVYSLGAADYAVEKQLELGIVSNGDNATLGDFDEARVAELLAIIDRVTDIDVSELSPEDLVANDFIDSSIGLPS
jgi:hypothetical protein